MKLDAPESSARACGTRPSGNPDGPGSCYSRPACPILGEMPRVSSRRTDLLPQTPAPAAANIRSVRGRGAISANVFCSSSLTRIRRTRDQTGWAGQGFFSSQ